MKRSVMEVYGTVSVVSAVFLLLLILLGALNQDVERVLVGINSCNAVIWFVLCTRARHMAMKNGCQKA